MDSDFEAGILSIVDDALLASPTIETFRSFKQALESFYGEGVDNATARVKHVVPDVDSLLHAPPEYLAALDGLLPLQRDLFFLDTIDLMGWTVCDEFEITEQDHKDGYRSLPEFWDFLRDSRARYRREFGR